MHESGNIISLPFGSPSLIHNERERAQLAFCYQCHCAVDLRGVSRTLLRSGHWARIGTCAHCGTTITRILKAAS